MSHPLAIFAPQCGARSETFIRRHVNELLPGRTVFVAQTAVPENQSGWQPSGPTLVLSTAVPNRQLRALQFTRRWLRRPPLDLRFRMIDDFFNRHSVEVFLGEFLNAALPWLRSQERSGRRLWGHAHGYDISAALREARFREAYRWYADAEGVITVSQVSKDRLVELGVSASRIKVVPCGVDVPDQITPRAPSATVRCLAVGRMVAKKAPIYLLDSFRRAASVIPELRLDYIGAGPLFSAAQQFVQISGLAERVTLHGGLPSERVAPFFNQSDILLQHSVVDPETGDEEGLPVAVLEGMAQGLPVVSTRHAGIPEAVVEGATGFLVDEGDTSGMADAIIQLARDPDRRHSLGKAGWRRAGEHFSWEHEKQQLASLLLSGSQATGTPGR